MQKKSIYVAYTGGTIGMQRSEHGYIPVSGHLQRQLALMPEFHRPEMPDFTIHEYEPLMDSSDMTPEDWQHIADDIRAHYDEYDGFVILHGTDTMAFTASALSFMLEHLGKPVIVTGSQIPLAELRSDGQINLLNALYVAANYPINEVALFFNNRLYRGNRTPKPMPMVSTPSPPQSGAFAGSRDPHSSPRHAACATGYRRADCPSHHAAADWRRHDLSGHFRRRGA
jgi:L-asparaginase